MWGKTKRNNENVTKKTYLQMTMTDKKSPASVSAPPFPNETKTHTDKKSAIL